MTETPSPDANESENSGSLVPYSQPPSDIDIIKQDIAQSIVSAGTPEEKRELLKMRAELEYQEETSKVNQYQRDLQKAQEARIERGSWTAIIMGSGLIIVNIFGILSYTGYPGLLFVLLGSAKLMGYSLSDISDLS